MFKFSPNKIGMIFTPMEKAIWPQWNVSPWFITSMEKVRFQKKFLLETVMVMVKDKRKCNKKMQCQYKLVLCIT